MYSILYLTGYKQVLPEFVTPESLILTLHAGYDVRKGTFRRAAVDPLKGREMAVAEMFFWSLAE